MQPIYSVIIGTELLNGRRIDKHFPFLVNALSRKGHSLAGHFVIPDNPDFMSKIFQWIKDENAFMFCFGGIGATPDDHTRLVAANVFTSSPPQPHPEAIKLIKAQFGSEATPIRLRMGELPKGASLLDNPVNQVPGFALNGRCFFVPGFPAMAQPMVLQAIQNHIPTNEIKFLTWNAIVYGPESMLVPLMEALPKDIALSSLPHMGSGGTRHVEIELKSSNHGLLKECVENFCSGLDSLSLTYTSKGYINEDFK
jgi:molybdopterin-biosynthesis enzyme MoeA-like protein